MANSTHQTELAKKLGFTADHSALSLKTQSLVRRLSLVARSLESKTLKEMGIRSDQLAIQRLERELVNQKHENEDLKKKLQESENKILELTQTAEGLKKESQEQLSLLKEKVEELQKQGKEKDEEIAKLIVQMEELNRTMLEFQKKSREQIEKAMQKAELFSQIQEKFSDAIILMEERLKMGLEGTAEPQILSQQPTLPTTTNEAPFNSPISAEEPFDPSPAKENFLQRFVRWWKEPVTTVHLFSFSKNPEN